MKLTFKAALAAGLFSLAACGGQGDDSLGENVQENAEAQADNVEAMAENASNESQEDALESNASAIREKGEEAEEAIDDSDVNAAAVNSQ